MDGTTLEAGVLDPVVKDLAFVEDEQEHRPPQARSRGFRRLLQSLT
jgi:hypothetical protein